MKRAHEKSRRTYDLDEVKRLAQNDFLLLTKQVLVDLLSLGMTRECVVDVILSLKQSDFYKSMTEHITRNEVYVDVYHREFGDLILYIKLKIKDGMLLVITSFKER